MQKDKHNEVVFAATTRIEGNLTAATQALYHLNRRATLLRDRKVKRELVSDDLLRRVLHGKSSEISSIGSPYLCRPIESPYLCSPIESQ